MVALLATGSFTFANDSKKEETKEVKIHVLSTTVNEQTADTCSITITVTRTTRTSTSTTVEIINATGTGSTCAEAEADARQTLAS